MCQRQRVQVTAYYHLQQLGHASRQGSVKLRHRSYGFCALHLKNMACPYKDCVHGLLAVTDEPQTENAHGLPEETMET